MSEWKATTDLQKNYPHFDAPLSLREIENIVKSPERVAQNAFYPFMHFVDEWQPYRSKPDGKPERKKRNIRYASRRDAYIFSYYRHILSELYEKRLIELSIEDCPIAYRRIPIGQPSRGGKCNIDFANDAFLYIENIGQCVSVALDIKGYFDSLDHLRIHALLCELLGLSTLPPDHFAVFKNITQYRYVDQIEVYRRLGYIAPERLGLTGIDKHKLPFRKMPKQLCSPEEFRNKIAGGDPKFPSLIIKNDQSYGIPQGAPISDLIANVYLIYFDKMLYNYVSARGGRYMRYSDDILVILPGGRQSAIDAQNFVVRTIRDFGDNLKIKDNKTCIVQYVKEHDRLCAIHIEGPQGKNGLEYLGFRFDGERVYVRESTISRFYRKVSASARAEAYRHVNYYPDASLDDLLHNFRYSLFFEKYSRIRDFERYAKDHGKWTFWSYLKRAAKTFGQRGDRILGQVSSFPNLMRKRVRSAIIKSYSRRAETISLNSEPT